MDISLTDPVSLRDTERRNSVNCVTEGQIMVQAPTHQIPGVYHRRIGDIIVTALSDGYLDGTVDVLQNITPDDAMRILNENLSRPAHLGVRPKAVPQRRAGGA